eukprot:44646-Amphidinium_carterae.1
MLASTPAARAQVTMVARALCSDQNLPAPTGNTRSGSGFHWPSVKEGRAACCQSAWDPTAESA